MKKLFMLLFVTVFLISSASAVTTLLNDLGNATGNVNGHNIGSSQRYSAFSFTASDDYDVQIVQMFVETVTGDTGNINVSIQGNNATDKPDGLVVEGAYSDTIAASSLSAGNYYNFTFTTLPKLISGTKYHVVFSVSDNGGATWIRLGESTGSGVDWTTSNDISDWGGTSSFKEINLKLFGEPSISVTTTLNSPGDNTNLVNSSVEFNATATPSSIDLRNATLNIWFDNETLFNATTNTITNTTNVPTWNITNFQIGNYHWNVFACGTNDTKEDCDWANSNRTFTWGIGDISTDTIATVYETESTQYNISFNVSSGTPTANLYWNGTKYTGTGTSLGSNNWRFAVDLVVAIGDGTKNFFWEIINGGLGHNETLATQTVGVTNISLCGSPYTVNFYNFTYQNETVARETVGATVVESLWQFWLGTGSVKKNISYSDTSEKLSHSFCGTPPDRTFNLDLSYSYDNAESSQRTFNPATTTISNVTTNTTLFLLPTADGQATTFQVVNIVDQPIEGATVTLARSGFGTVSQTNTGASGTTTVFLNPNLEYALTVLRTGFTTFQTTQTFPTNSFTVTLGGGVNASINTSDYTAGVAYDFGPKIRPLANNTYYNFNFSMTSSNWIVSSFAMYVRNESGFLLGSNISTENAGTVWLNLSTGNHSKLTAEGYWIIQGEQQNRTTTWQVVNEGDTSFSILQFFSDLKRFVTTGFFGLDDFGLRLIVFVTILLFAGILSFRFGLTSPIAIAGLVFAAVVFFDVGVGLISFSSESKIIEHFPSIFAGLILIAIGIAEVRK
jgi:hypothetical protein